MENVIDSILEVLDAQLANCIKAGARFYSGHIAVYYETRETLARGHAAIYESIHHRPI